MDIPILEAGEDRPLPWNDSPLFQWSPSMDVFAVSSSSEILVIRLLSWEIIWRLSTSDWNAEITALTWKPDGRTLAVGSRDGVVRLLDLETSNILHTFGTRTERQADKASNSESAAVIHMSWKEDKVAKADSSATLWGPDELWQSIPALAPLPQQRSNSTLFKSQSASLSSMDTKDVASMSRLNVLTVVTRDGRVHIRLYGSLPIGEFRLTHEGNVVSVDTSNDMSQLWIVSEIQTPSHKSRLLLDVLPTGLDTSMAQDLKIVADKAENLNSILRYIDAVIKLMNEEQAKLEEAANGNWKRFEEVLYDHGASTTPQVELKHMLATGKRTESVEMFLTQHVGDRGVKIWEKNVDQGCTGLKSRALEFLKPACERLFMALTELLAVPPRRKSFALQADSAAVQDALRLCKKMMSMVQRLVLAIEETAIGLTRIIRWLKLVLDDIVEGHDSSRSAYDSAPMQQYLDESFQAGAIGSYFDEESDVGSLPDLAQRLQRKIATFFNGGSRKPLDSSAHHNVVLLDYPKEEKNDQRSYFVNYSDEDVFHIGVFSNERVVSATSLQLTLPSGFKGPLSVQHARFMLPDITDRLGWQDDTSVICHKIWPYGKDTVLLGLKGGETEDGPQECILFAGLGEPEYAFLPYRENGEEGSLVDFSNSDSELEISEFQDLRGTVKADSRFVVLPNPARGLLGLVDPIDERFSFVDVDSSLAAADEGE